MDDEDLVLRVPRGGDQLTAIASLLNVPVGQFFDAAGAGVPAQMDVALRRELADLRAAYLDLDREDRNTLLVFARRLATARG